MKKLFGVLWCFAMALLLAGAIDGPPDIRGKALTGLILVGLATLVLCALQK